MPLNPRWLVGKVIAKVEMGPFDGWPDDDHKVCHSPIITFTDGSSIRFVTEETDLGEYGTDIVYSKRGG